MASEMAKKIAEKHNAGVKVPETPGIGHNSATGVARDHLKAFVERVERLEEEKKATADDIKDIYAEAKGTGFDVKALRAIVRMRKQDADERKEHETIIDTYKLALGMID